MKKNRIVLLVLIIISMMLLSGCSKIPSPPKNVYVPEIGKVATAEIGQNMYSKTYAGFPFEESVLFEDDEATQRFANSKSSKRYLKRENGTCQLVYVKTSGRYRVYMTDEECNGEFTKGYYHMLDVPLKYKVIPAEPLRLYPQSFKYVVLYQGKVGSKINISFREFMYSHRMQDFIIRDAFTQNIEYELDENGKAMIGFKGLRIEVLKATNMDITYKVVKDYN